MNCEDFLACCGVVFLAILAVLIPTGLIGGTAYLCQSTVNSTETVYVRGLKFSQLSLPFQQTIREVIDEDFDGSKVSKDEWGGWKSVYQAADKRYPSLDKAWVSLPFFNATYIRKVGQAYEYRLYHFYYEDETSIKFYWEPVKPK